VAWGVDALGILAEGDIGIFFVDLVMGSYDIDIAIFTDLHVNFFKLLASRCRDVDAIEVDHPQAWRSCTVE
jgi:hypothetical protein